MKFRFFCFVYGDWHVSLLERILVRSLSQSRNRKAIPPESVISLYSDQQSMAAASTALDALAIVEEHIVAIDSDSELLQQRLFSQEIQTCFEQGATLIVLCPDNFWGDGSLANLLLIAGEQDACIAAPHVRVDQDKFLGAMGEGELDNPSLVALAMRTLHPSWIEADASQDESNSYFTGISMRAIGNGLYAVSHRLPTVWLARFTKEDVEFFHRNLGIRGLWDHHWPAQLVASKRQRVIGSSDAVFIAELTPSTTHRTQLNKTDPKAPDRYCAPSLHAGVNRNVTAIWRAVDNP